MTSRQEEAVGTAWTENAWGKVGAMISSLFKDPVGTASASEYNATMKPRPEGKKEIPTTRTIRVEGVISEEQRQKNQRARALLQSWRDEDDPKGQKQRYDTIMGMIEDHRLSDYDSPQQ